MADDIKGALGAFKSSPLKGPLKGALQALAGQATNGLTNEEVSAFIKSAKDQLNSPAAALALSSEQKAAANNLLTQFEAKADELTKVEGKQAAAAINGFVELLDAETEEKAKEAARKAQTAAPDFFTAIISLFLGLLGFTPEQVESFTKSMSPAEATPAAETTPTAPEATSPPAADSAAPAASASAAPKKEASGMDNYSKGGYPLPKEPAVLAGMNLPPRIATSQDGQIAKDRTTSKVNELEESLPTLEKKALEEQQKFRNAFKELSASATTSPAFINLTSVLDDYQSSVKSRAGVAAEYAWIKTAHENNVDNTFVDDHTPVTDSESESFTLRINTNSDILWDSAGNTGVNRPRVKKLEEETDAATKNERVIENTLSENIDKYIAYKSAPTAAVPITEDEVKKYAADPELFTKQQQAAREALTNKTDELAKLKTELLANIAAQKALNEKIGEFSAQKAVAEDANSIGGKYGPSGVFSNYFTSKDTYTLIDKKGEQLRTQNELLDAAKKEQTELLKKIDAAAAEAGRAQQNIDRTAKIDEALKLYAPAQAAENAVKETQASITSLNSFLNNIDQTISVLKEQEKKKAEGEIAAQAAALSVGSGAEKSETPAAEAGTSSRGSAPRKTENVMEKAERLHAELEALNAERGDLDRATRGYARDRRIAARKAGNPAMETYHQAFYGYKPETATAMRDSREGLNERFYEVKRQIAVLENEPGGAEAIRMVENRDGIDMRVATLRGYGRAEDRAQKARELQALQKQYEGDARAVSTAVTIQGLEDDIARKQDEVAQIESTRQRIDEKTSDLHQRLDAGKASVDAALRAEGGEAALDAARQLLDEQQKAQRLGANETANAFGETAKSLVDALKDGKISAVEKQAIQAVSAGLNGKAIEEDKQALDKGKAEAEKAIEDAGKKLKKFYDQNESPRPLRSPAPVLVKNSPKDTSRTV